MPSRRKASASPRRAASQRAASKQPAPQRAAPPPAPAPRALILALGATFALRLVAIALPPPRLWGLDTLRRFPTAAAVIIVLIGALGFVPPIARAIERTLDRIGTRWDRAGRGADALVAVASALVLFVLRDPVRFVGDFEARWSQLVTRVQFTQDFPQASPLDRLLNSDLTRVFTTLGLAPGPALQAVGALVGGLFVFVALAFLREIGAARATRVAAAAMVLGSGAMLHFAGYDKLGPLLVAIAIACYGAARLARDGRGAWALGLGATACVLSHRTAYLLLPAAALVMAQAWRRAQTTRTRAHLAAAALVMVAIAASLLPGTVRLFIAHDRPLQETLAPPGGEGLAAAFTRVLDALNLMFLIAPLWPVGIAAAWLARGAPAPGATPPEPAGARRFSLVPAALLALAAETALVLATRGAQGAPRDWDMNLGPATLALLVLTAAFVTITRRRGAGGALAPAVTTALAASLTLWGIHTTPAIAIARIEDTLTLRSSWNDAAWARANNFLGLRAIREQRGADAVRNLEAAVAFAPNARFLYELGLAYRLAGRVPEAAAAFERSRAVGPHRPNAWVGFTLLALDAHDYPAAIAFADSALARSPRQRDATVLREEAVRALGGGAR